MISPSVVFKRKTKTVHLLQISEIEFFENEKSDLHKLRQISPIINLPELYFDIFKMNILLLWGEILNLILKNEGKNEELFDYLTHSIEYLNSTHNDIGNFNLYFLYRLRRTRLDRRRVRYRAVCVLYLARHIYSDARSQYFFLSDGNRNHKQNSRSGYIQHCRCYGLRSRYGRSASVFQFRRYGAYGSACGDRACFVYFKVCDR